MNDAQKVINSRITSGTQKIVFHFLFCTREASRSRSFHAESHSCIRLCAATDIDNSRRFPRRVMVHLQLTREDPALSGKKFHISSAIATRRGRGVGLVIQVGSVVAILWSTSPFLLLKLLSKPEAPDTRIVGTSPVKAFQKDDNEQTARPSTESPNWVETVSDGVVARAFDPWNTPLPCFAPDDRQNYQKPVPLVSIHKGFMFMKLMKTGGSTAAGINIRIMKYAANQLQNDDVGDERFRYCQGRFEHSWGYDMLAGRERDGTSFLWTIDRNPTKRVVSQFFHFEVSRKEFGTPLRARQSIGR